MSLFPSTLTGRVLDDGVTEPPVIELQGISAGQLSLVLTQYTPLETTTQNTADIGTNAAAIAALQGQVSALPAPPDLTPYALAADLAAAEGLIAANASGLTAVNTSLTLGLASKANQSALDALQVQVDGKSTPASVDLKLANHPTIAAMNSSIASTNNATLATVATTYALKSVVDQLAIDVAARQTAADVDQRVATALLSYLTQTAYQAGQALQDARLDGHDADILALQTQNAGPFATAGDLSNLQVTLQSAIDGILAEIATLGGATNLVNAPAWLGNVTWDLLAGTNQIRNLHATGPLSIQLANDDWTLSFGCDAYSTQGTDDAISTALSDYFTRAEVTVTVVAAIDESKGYTDTQLTDYSTTAEMNQAITDALVPFETAAQRDAAIAAALAVYYTSAQTDAALAAGLASYSTTVQMNQAIADALVPFETAAQRDAAIAAALAAYYTSAQTDAALAAALASYYTSAQTDAAIAAAVALSNGQSWTGGPTFNLFGGSNVLRNLSVAGALTASFQNLDDTILIESDSYARSETYSQAETGAAITAAIDALDLSQFQNEAQVLALIATALVPYWDQTEVSTYVAGELSNYATTSSVTSAIASALSSYDDSSQVDSKIIAALLDFYTRTEVDQQITNALGNVDLSNYYTSAQTDSLFYPRTELDSLLTATLTQYWTSGRTQTEIDDAVAGLLDQATADTRYFVRAPGAESGNIFNLVQEQFTPRIVRNLLLEAPLQGDAILGNLSTLRLRCDSWTKAEADSRFLRSNNLAPLDARYLPNTPGAEGGGIFNLVQTQFTPVVIRNLLCQSPLSCQPILGNGSTLQITCDCWSKGQSDGRYPLVANFNSLGTTVNSIDGRVTTLETDVGAIDGRITALENSGGVAPTADLTVNSLTATTFVETPQLQSAAGDLQIQNALVTVRKEDGALLASFADGGISLDRDVTVAAASTLNTTTADITQLTVGSTAATGAFNSNSSVTANLEVVSNLRLEAPLVRCDPTAPWLSIEGGAQGVLVNDTLRVNGAIAPEASLPYLFLSGGTTGLEMNTKFAAVTGLGDPGGFCELAVINQAPTGVARLFLATQNSAGGSGELVALANGGVQLNALNQNIALNTTGGTANLVIEPNTGGASNGEVICFYGFQNLSDERLKTNVQPLSATEVQELFDGVEARSYDRVDGAAKQTGFVAQEVYKSGPLGKSFCKLKNFEDRELMTLDYQRMTAVLWQTCKSLQKRIEKLEKKKRGRSD